jgi:hypothetical protein
MGSASPSRAIDELFSRVDSARVPPAAASHESSIFRRFQRVLSGISFALKTGGSAERLALNVEREAFQPSGVEVQQC